MAGMQNLGEFEQLVLFAVLRLGDDAFGVRIRQEIEARTGRPVSAGAIYTTLGRLENRGYVDSSVGETAPARGGRRRKYYRLRAEGAEALQRAYGHVQEMAAGMVAKLATHVEGLDDE
jgi:DNA-binding PadR family transcriptional regulator